MSTIIFDDETSQTPPSSPVSFRNPLYISRVLEMASATDGNHLHPHTPSPAKQSTMPNPRTPSANSISRPSPVHQSTSVDRTFDPMSEKSGDHVTIDVLSVLDGADESRPPLDKSDDPLITFHTALGIPPPKPVKTKPKRNVLGRKKRPSPDAKEPKQPKISNANKGVYKSVLSNERRTRLTYQACDVLLTFCMFLQIIVGAAVTAFGAGDANHTIITVFGATNTAVASLLAVLKSKGLPNRLRQDWNGWRELREHIEEKEREIDMRVQGHGEGLPPLDVWAVVRDIEARYQTMRLTLEANRPDTYIRVPHTVGLPK